MLGVQPQPQRASGRTHRYVGCCRRALAARPSRGRASPAVTVVADASSSNPAGSDKYDYIIVGGGTSGCVLANRLTADGRKRVLMLEAGARNGGALVSVPAGITRLFKHPVFDWGLSSVKQQQLSARDIYLARGRLLGGSSCTNATLYHRGSPADYDAWGLDGWRSQDVLDWFISAENNASGASRYHGTSGTMCVESPRFETPLHDEFFAAAAAAGLPANPDFNDWSRPQEGYGEFQVTQRAGERADMARTYLSPAMSRDNLKVVTDAPTIRVVFNKASSKGSAATAAGVEFRAGGATHSAELAAGGEVLLCAGTIHSPWLLQRSGVGAAQLLREHSVDVVADSPGVGQGLQDHPGVVLAARMSEEHNGMTATGQVYGKRGNISLKALFQYVWNKTGPLTTTGCDHGAFVRTSASHAEPDLQMRFVPGFSLDPDGVNSYAMFGELKKRGLSWPAGVTIQLLACRPRSRGSVRLASSDALAPPSIDINYFSAQEDMDTLVAGLTKAREVMAQRPLAQYVTEEVYPGPANSSVEQLQAYVRKTVHSGNALVGTCRMGASAADGSVVSSDSFKVHGVEGVRVVDASVIPRIPGGQTGAATVMVAERAASLLAKGTPIRGASGSSAPSAPVPAMA